MSVLVVVFLTGVLTLFLKGKWANNIAILGTLGAFIVSFFSEITFGHSYQKMFWFDADTVLWIKITLIVNLHYIGIKIISQRCMLWCYFLYVVDFYYLAFRIL